MTIPHGTSGQRHADVEESKPATHSPPDPGPDGSTIVASGHATPLRLLPPSTVPLDPEQERQAVRALADLLADWWRRREQR
jgi:hypothetical protein